MTIKKVGVIGCGLMGSGIAQVCAQSGFETVVREVNEELLRKGLGKIDKFLARGVEKGKLTPEDKQATMDRLTGTTKLEDLADCDLVIEAITENPAVKRETYEALDGACKRSTVFATNTSSLSVTDLLTATEPDRHERFIGLHFFNPVPLMKLVEVVRTVATDEAVFDAATGFARAIGKEPIRCTDRSGFIVNRLLVPYLLDAIRALEEGVGTVEEIDAGMTLGCGYPMGPFTLLDFVGLDTTLSIAEIMFREYHEKRFAPPPLLRRMVAAGRLGKKSGRGFYDYAKK